MSLPNDSTSASKAPARGRRGLWIGLGAALLVVIILAGVSAVFLAPRLCGVTEPQRHGLACDIPLPANASFDGEVAPPAGAVPGITTQNVQYHVANTTSEAVRTFYTQQLPANGWTCLDAEDPVTISAEQGNRGVAVLVAPSAGTSKVVIMIVSVVTFSSDIGRAC